MAAALPVTRVVVTNNHDVASLIRRLDRLMLEIGKSSSANVSAIMPYDMGRVEQHLSAVKSFKAWATGEPFMDAPESNPIQIEVTCYGQVQPIENDSAWDLVQLIDTVILEVANSVSSRNNSGMLPADSKRFDDYVLRMAKLITYIKGSEPLDNPESTPREVNTGEGLTGIKFAAGGK